MTHDARPRFSRNIGCRQAQFTSTSGLTCTVLSRCSITRSTFAPSWRMFEHGELRCSCGDANLTLWVSQRRLGLGKHDLHLTQCGQLVLLPACVATWSRRAAAAYLSEGFGANLFAPIAPVLQREPLPHMASAANKFCASCRKARQLSSRQALLRSRSQI